MATGVACQVPQQDGTASRASALGYLAQYCGFNWHLHQRCMGFGRKVFAVGRSYASGMWHVPMSARAHTCSVLHFHNCTILQHGCKAALQGVAVRLMPAVPSRRLRPMRTALTRTSAGSYQCVLCGREGCVRHGVSGVVGPRAAKIEGLCLCVSEKRCNPQKKA